MYWDNGADVLHDYCSLVLPGLLWTANPPGRGESRWNVAFQTRFWPAKMPLSQQLCFLGAQAELFFLWSVWSHLCWPMDPRGCCRVVLWMSLCKHMACAGGCLAWCACLCARVWRCFTKIHQRGWLLLVAKLILLLPGAREPINEVFRPKIRSDLFMEQVFAHDCFTQRDAPCQEAGDWWA